MTLKDKIFHWLDEHPEEFEKTGYGSNARLRSAFPTKNRKILSMYKIYYKRLMKKNELNLEKTKELDSHIKQKEENKNQDSKKSNIKKITLKERVFNWFDEHPEFLDKSGDESIAKIVEDFPEENIITLSNYTIKYKKELNQKKRDNKKYQYYEINKDKYGEKK